MQGKWKKNFYSFPWLHQWSEHKEHSFWKVNIHFLAWKCFIPLVNPPHRFMELLFVKLVIHGSNFGQFLLTCLKVDSEFVLPAPPSSTKELDEGSKELGGKMSISCSHCSGILIVGASCRNAVASMGVCQSALFWMEESVRFLLVSLQAQWRRYMHAWPPLV